MKTLQYLIVALAAFAAVGLVGCDRSAQSRVPTQQEIDEGKERRLAEIEKLNIPESQKQMMRDQLQGKNPGRPDPAQGR